jgi:hypothetical protein
VSKDKGTTWDTLSFETTDVLIRDTVIIAVARNVGIMFSADTCKSWVTKNSGIEYLDTLGICSILQVGSDIYIIGNACYRTRLSHVVSEVEVEHVDNYLYLGVPYPSPSPDGVVQVKVLLGF